MNNTVLKLVKSWENTEGKVKSLPEILDWIKTLNASTFVDVKECSIQESTFWFYDDYNGEVLNRKRGFFSVKGMRLFQNDIFIKEQPMIIQPEIGYLGIVCKEIEGILHFLMQAKIEPGNINCIQISPTIQATKSNFTRVHGGNLPRYFECFENASKYHIIYDQIQSEQSARFYKKRNRNIIIEISEEIQVDSNYCWMTLGQIKQLMKIDNLVNMDTRTVISGLPFFSKNENDIAALEEYFYDKPLFHSMFCTDLMESLTDVRYYINDYRMFQDTKVTEIPLNELIDWRINEYGIECCKKADFMVKYYDITIEGREVHSWVQPLFKATGKALFGLLTCEKNGVKKFLVSTRQEIGTLDMIELAPSIQIEVSDIRDEVDIVEKVFFHHLNRNETQVDVLLSEEGGRFYHEENRNVIINIDEKEIPELPKGYFWLDYSTLIYMMQMNQLLNIQLRNMLSLLSI